MKKVITILEYILTLVAGVLLTIGIYLERSLAQSITTGLGIGLYNAIIILLIGDVKDKEV